MSRLAIGLLGAVAIAAVLVSRVVPWVAWVADAFLAFLTAAVLDRRARLGHPVGRMAVGVAVLLGGCAAAAYAVSDAFAPFALGAVFAAGAALLVAARHEGRKLFAFLGTRPAFYGVTALLLTLAVTSAVVAGNALVARSPAEIDMTRARVHSLAQESLLVLSEVRGDLSVHVFFRREEAAARHRLAPLLERYERASPRVRVLFHDPDLEPRLTAELHVHEQGARVIVVSERGMVRIVPSGRILSVRDPQDGRRLLQFREFTESDITNGILRATRPRPRLCFLTGHGERGLDDAGPSGYALLRRALEDNNFEIAPLSLGASAAVPDACRAVVVAGITAAIFPGEALALRRHLEHGGGVLIFAEPGVDPGLGELLGEAGIALGDGTVADPRGEGLGPAVVVPDHIGTHASVTAFAGTSGLALYLDGARPIEARGKEAAVLLESSPAAWAGPMPGEAFRSGRDRKGPVPLAVAGTTPHKGRVAVVGDADFASDRYLQFPGNRLLALALSRWVAAEDKLVAVKPHGWKHSRLTWTSARRRLVRVLTQAVLPGLAIFIAIYLWRTRRRL
jgi:hypothetical protein